MNLTTLFRLRKPEGTDPVDVKDFNDNFDIVDAEIGKRLEKTGNGSDLVTSFSQAGSRANLTSGEKISLSFGKITKWFADLKAVAFSGSYNDLANKPSIPGGAAASQGVANNCTTTAAGYVLDARQGKTLMDKANQINSDFAVRLPGGSGIMWDGTNFYGTTTGGVKKKLGSGARLTILTTWIDNDWSNCRATWDVSDVTKVYLGGLNHTGDGYDNVYHYIDNVLVDKKHAGDISAMAKTYDLTNAKTFSVGLERRWCNTPDQTQLNNIYFE